MSEQTPTPVDGKIEGILKGLSADERAALVRALEQEPKVDLTEEALNKALDGIAERLKRPAPTPADTGTDATGFLKSLDGQVRALDDDLRQVGEGTRSLGAVALGLKAGQEKLERGLGELQGQVVRLLETMAKPQPGRAITGAAPVPHPVGDTSPQLTKGGLLQVLGEKFTAERDATRRHRIGEEIYRVQAGGQPDATLCRSLGIELK